MPGQRLLEPEPEPELEVLDKLLVSRYFARLGCWRPPLPMCIWLPIAGPLQTMKL